MEKKRGRPYTYTNDEDRPVVMTFYVSRELLEKLNRCSYEDNLSKSQIVREGLEIRLTKGHAKPKEIE